jgi:hypothetical protein
MITQIRCCKDCKERTIEPNCHNVCERYLAEKEKGRQIKKAALSDEKRELWRAINQNQGSRN